MVVQQEGYKTKKEVEELVAEGVDFSVYQTHKNTDIILLYTHRERVDIYRPKKDRLPWKLIEGRVIARCERRFSTRVASTLKNFEKINWNSETQIMVYEKYKV